MDRILTGIQSTGVPHLGNVLSAIFPAISLARQGGVECLYFIADLHSLTTIRNSEQRIRYVQEVAITWMACGFCEPNDILYRQSRVPELLELTWYLSCHVPYPMLANAHAFKERANDLSKVNAGIFTYPVLMAADILLYQVKRVPVGKDQTQHVEIARDIAAHINHTYGRRLFEIPVAVVQEQGIVVGTDGRKMSKSYGNTLNIFLDEKQLEEQVMSIQTDDKALKEPKHPATCRVFNLYALLASGSETDAMRVRYESGGYGYREAKQALLHLLLRRFSKERAAYAYYKANFSKVEEKLAQGEQRARQLAKSTLQGFREVLGF